MTAAGWGAVALLEGFLLLIGICLRIGLDMPWRAALVPFCIPPATVLVLHIGSAIADQLHLYS